MTGMLIGCLLFSQISDWYGRKTSLIAAELVVIVSGLILSFTPYFYAFCALRIIMAIGHGGKKMSTTLGRSLAPHVQLSEARTLRGRGINPES